MLSYWPHASANLSLFSATTDHRAYVPPFYWLTMKTQLLHQQKGGQRCSHIMFFNEPHTLLVTMPFTVSARATEVSSQEKKFCVELFINAVSAEDRNTAKCFRSRGYISETGRHCVVGCYQLQSLWGALVCVVSSGCVPGSVCVSSHHLHVSWSEKSTLGVYPHSFSNCKVWTENKAPIFFIVINLPQLTTIHEQK